MIHSNPTVFGVLVLAASASASLDAAGLRRHHARVAGAPGWKRSDVSGVAYYGYQNNTQNACGTYSSDDDMIIGIGPDYYGNMDIASPQCFQHITVSLKSDPTKSVDVTLTDACENCGDPSNIYVSPAAFKALNGGSLDAGVLDVTWSFGSSASSTSESSSSSDQDTASPSTSASSSTSESSSSSDQDTSSSSTPSSSSDEDDEDCDQEDSSNTEEATAPAATATAAATTDKAATSTVKQATTTDAKAATTTAKAATTTKAATSTTKTSAKSTTSAASTKSSSAGWKLTNSLEGDSFLDFFNYDSGTGDNGGVAQYVDGASKGLAYKSGNQVVLAVDTTESVSARNSLRMVSKTSFNAKDTNLFIFDIAHMPAVCGTWPAVWFTGANWPYQGEIDVVEGVSLYNNNIYSVHTGSGCSIPSSAVSSMAQVSIVDSVASGGNNCDATVNPAGCGFSDHAASSFGPGFNAAGGGVFALQFDTTGIKTWFFQAGSVPSDISSKNPDPSSWGSPRMSVPTSSCSPTTYFQDLMMIVDTNLGGSFTEGVWATDGAGGQATSCKSSTGAATAADYILKHGSEFGEAAQFKINGFYIYNQ
ncbi:glycoside hydrolase family 16 protein [Mycena alexandri]|uniref:Glycoside hydrolase family 16 protein n=1 Tax=Mycena alexandri TaxID=1745969 RepID=A0AAD6SU64_9AGAR|nr:glycoside hydrolase family 16 protein [Mycena alexandri]